MLKAIGIFVLFLTAIMAGCAPEEDEPVPIFIEIHDDDGDGIYVIPASAQTANMRITADVGGRSVDVLNANDERRGSRIFRDSTSTIFSDGWIAAGESGSSENVQIDLDTPYTLEVVSYVGNPLEILNRLLEVGEEAWWENIRTSYTRSLFTATITFESGN